MRDFFYLDGVRCDDIGIKLQAPIEFSATKPKIDTISIPGRNGDLHIYEGSFANVSGVARCFALEPANVNETLNAIGRFALLDKGYRRLEVSNEPEYYRMAVIKTGPETEIRMRRLAPFTLDFNCKPQKFLTSGEKPIIVDKSGKVIVNNWFPANPIIEVVGNGTGTVTINEITVQIKSMSGGMTLDCETQNAYSGTKPQNSNIHAPVFPVFEHGENEVTFTGGVQRIDIIPRWWTL